MRTSHFPSSTLCLCPCKITEYYSFLWVLLTNYYNLLASLLLTEEKEPSLPSNSAVWVRFDIKNLWSIQQMPISCKCSNKWQLTLSFLTKTLLTQLTPLCNIFWLRRSYLNAKIIANSTVCIVHCMFLLMFSFYDDTLLQVMRKKANKSVLNNCNTCRINIKPHVVIILFSYLIIQKGNWFLKQVIASIIQQRVLNTQMFLF